MLTFLTSLAPRVAGTSPDPDPVQNYMDVYLMGGQSLCLGLGDATLLPADMQGPQSGTGIYAWRGLLSGPGSKTIELINPGKNTQAMRDGKFGAEVGFAHLRKSLNSTPFVIGKFANGGTALTPNANKDWHPDSHELADDWLDMARALLLHVQSLGYTPRVQCIFWHQGESDATTTNAPLYAGRMAELVAYWDAELPALQTAKYVICHIEENGKAVNVQLNQQKTQHAATNPTRFLIQSERVQSYPRLSATDVIHVNWEGCLMMGEDWFNLIHPNSNLLQFTP